MKKKVVLVCLIVFVLAFPLSTFADIGIGGIVGYGQPLDPPSGLSLKVNKFPVVSLEWHFGTSRYVKGTIDYWFINDKLDRNIYWYLGGGVKASVGSSDFGLGLRVPIGIQWYFMPRFELFGELVPGFTILNPSGQFDLSEGIGLRFHL